MTSTLHSPAIALVKPKHPALRQRAEAVDLDDPETARLAHRMLATCKANPYGIAGLAAPQVGRPLRLIVVKRDLANLPGEGAFAAIANPELVDQRGKVDAIEGCLTFRGWWWTVQRAARVRVRGTDALTGEPIAASAEGYGARLWLHELDHLAGMVLPDGGYPPAQPPRR